MKRTRHVSLTAVSLVVALLLGCGRGEVKASGAVVAQPADMLALLPEGMVGYVQIGSLGALGDVVHTQRSAFQPNVAREDPLSWFVDVDPDLVDHGQPLAIALSSAAGGLATTFLLPARDAEALREASGAQSAEEQGGYVALSFGADHVPAAAGSAMTRGMPAGIISARFDVRPIVEAYRPMLDMFLGMMQMSMQAAPVDGIPAAFDMQALMGAYVDGFRAVLDDAEVVELAVRSSGGTAGLWSSLQVAEGSPFGGFGPVRSGDLAEVAALVDSSSPIVVLGRCDYGDLMEHMDPFMRTFYSTLVEEGIDEVLGSWRGVFGLTSGTFAGDGTMGKGGMAFSSYFGCRDPEAFVDGYVQILEDGMLDLMGMHYEQLDDVTVEGVVVKRAHGQMDVEALFPGSPEMQDAYRRTGSDVVDVNLVAGSSVAGMVMPGKGTDRLEATVRRMRSDDNTVDPLVATLVESIDGYDMGFAASMDILQLMAGMSELMPDGAGDMPDLGDGSSVMTMVLGVTGHTWELDFGVDMAGLAAASRR